MASIGVIKLVLIGDVHGYWDPDLDPAALRFLQPDAAIFVGDFGEEDVSLVEQIAGLTEPKAVMLGNHDAWKGMYYGLGPRGVNEQVALLKDDYIGYGAKRFTPASGQSFSVVGARPFSDGNATIPSFTAKRHRVHGMAESADKICDLVRSQNMGEPIILVGHNGPSGLGARHHDPCGKDFTKKGGDFGDKDLEMALQQAAERKRDIALVTFGHMHQALQPRWDIDTRPKEGGLRNMADIDEESGTVYLNCAVVPRHRIVEGKQATHFMEVYVDGHVVVRARNVWIADVHKPSIVQSQEILKTTTNDQGGMDRMFYRAFDETWSQTFSTPLQCSAN